MFSFADFLITHKASNIYSSTSVAIGQLKCYLQVVLLLKKGEGSEPCSVYYQLKANNGFNKILYQK